MVFICTVQRRVEALGATRSSVSAVSFEKVVFLADIEKLELLSSVVVSVETSVPLLLYAGSGCDVVFPLEYVRLLFPAIKSLSCVFVDVIPQQGLIETVLDDLGISFARDGNVLMFWWGDILVRLRIVTCDVFSFIDTFSGFDIYFERAFRIMKDGQDKYEAEVATRLNTGGVVISDSGFLGVGLDYVIVDPTLSVYGEMVVGKKK